MDGLNEALIREKYRHLTLTLIDRGLTITTMESMTAGLIASLITDTEGSSAVLKGAFITYSNEGKIMQGVPAEIIEDYGVYSCETAEAMALACKKAYMADIGIGITGSAGNPDPANPDSQPGVCYYGISLGERLGGQTISGRFECRLPLSRYGFKLYAADRILDRLMEIIL